MAESPKVDRVADVRSNLSYFLSVVSQRFGSCLPQIIDEKRIIGKFSWSRFELRMPILPPCKALLRGGPSMNRGKLVFVQLMHHLPLTTFRRCVTRCRDAFKVKSFSCLDQFLCMAFAQLTFRESLRDIELCLRAQNSKRYHLGIRSAVARNTLANANTVRDWRIYADFAQSLLGIARPLYA